VEGGTLRLASFASAAAAILPLAVAEFRRRYPAIELDITMADPIDSIPMLRSGRLDVALSHDALGRNGEAALREGADEAGDVDILHLFDDPMYVAMHTEHPLADADRVELAQFAGEPWMLATTNKCPDSRLFLRACHAAGFEPQIAFQNDDYQAMLGFVAAGVGVALIPDMVARGVRDDVVVRNLDPPPPPRPTMAVVPVGYRSHAAAAMLDVLREVSDAWAARCLAPAATSPRSA
jgi:DNA-binding transcriptional LysR family regulator